MQNRRILVALFFVSPKQSYGFSLLLESHAVDTYGEFVDANEEVLKTLPVPDVAFEYFNNFLFYYQEMQVTGEGSKERPQLESLYDVFANILADEVRADTFLRSLHLSRVVLTHVGAERAFHRHGGVPEIRRNRPACHFQRTRSVSRCSATRGHCEVA